MNINEIAEGFKNEILKEHAEAIQTANYFANSGIMIHRNQHNDKFLDVRIDNHKYEKKLVEHCPITNLIINIQEMIIIPIQQTSSEEKAFKKELDELLDRIADWGKGFSYRIWADVHPSKPIIEIRNGDKETKWKLSKYPTLERHQGTLMEALVANGVEQYRK